MSLGLAIACSSANCLMVEPVLIPYEYEGKTLWATITDGGTFDNLGNKSFTF